MRLSRRSLLALGASVVAAPAFAVVRTARPARRLLLVVSLRGGIDGLNLVAPVDDAAYRAARAAALRVVDSGDQAGLALDRAYPGFDFRLHPAAESLHALYHNREAAIIHAAGLPHGTRSHFVATELMERGVAGEAGLAPRDGWMTRAAIAIGATSPGAAFAVSDALPWSMQGARQAIALGDAGALDWGWSEPFKRALKGLYAGDGMLQAAGRQAMAAVQRLAKGFPRNADGTPTLPTPPAGIVYNETDGFAVQLQFLAGAVLADPTIALAAIDVGGWDTHESQPDVFLGLVKSLSDGLTAFHRHLQAARRPAIVVVLSEFGRRLKASESRGTDHGHGSVMIVLGDGVMGGRCYGTWPGLAAEQLDRGADLAVTTDYRMVLGEALAAAGAGAQGYSVFPGFSANGGRLGLFT